MAEWEEAAGNVQVKLNQKSSVTKNDAGVNLLLNVVAKDAAAV